MALVSFPTAAHTSVNNLDAAVRDHVGESISFIYIYLV